MKNNRTKEKDKSHGWLCPDGTFIPSEPTPPVRDPGALGGHEQAALEWLSKSDHAALYSQLHDYATKEADRLGIEFMDWTDLDGHDIIKKFMVRHGFERVADD